MEWPSRRDLIIKLRPQPPVAPRTKNVCLGCVEVDILILCWWTFPEVKQSLSVKVVSERKIEMIMCMSCDEKKKMLRTFALLYTQTASASRCLQQMVDRALIGSTTAGARKCRAATPPGRHRWTRGASHHFSPNQRPCTEEKMGALSRALSQPCHDTPRLRRNYLLHLKPH